VGAGTGPAEEPGAFEVVLANADGPRYEEFVIE
jgi:hypothetical protein